MQINNPTSGSAGTVPTINKTGAFTNYLRSLSSIVNGQISANAVRAYLITVPANCNMQASVNSVVATALGKVAVALYLSDPTTGLPGTRAYSFDEIDISTTGVKLTTALAVNAGQYWVVTNNSVTSAAGGVKLATFLSDNLNALSDAAGVVINRCTATSAYSYPLPSSSAFTWTSDATAPAVAVSFKMS